MLCLYIGNLPLSPQLSPVNLPIMDISRGMLIIMNIHITFA